MKHGEYENAVYEYDPCEDCMEDGYEYFTDEDGQIRLYCPQCPCNKQGSDA